MKKPKVILLSYLEHIRDLDPYVDLHYYNCRMPEEKFFELAKDADLIIEQEFNDNKAVYDKLLDKVKVPKAVWLIDTHTQPRHPEYAKHFDHVFVAINRLRDKFEMKTHHLPLACTFASNRVVPCTQDKIYDVAFVGQFLVKGGRRAILDKLASDLTRRGLKHFFATMYGEGYIDTYQKAIVGFNKSIGDECNFRIFETMAMGVPLVTDWNDECALVPGLRERVFGYITYDQIIPQIEKVLSKGYDWIDVFARDNQEWLKNGHMITHRHLEMIEKSLGYSLRKDNA